MELPVGNISLFKKVIIKIDRNISVPPEFFYAGEENLQGLPLNSESEIDKLFTGINLLLPTCIVSYKILLFPFELKNERRYEGLARTALEGLIPLSLEDVYIIVNRISNNRLLVEYFTKKSLEKVFAGNGILDNIRKKKKIRIYAPFFLIQSYIKNMLSAALSAGTGNDKISVTWKPLIENGLNCSTMSETCVNFVYSAAGELEEIKEFDAGSGLNKVNVQNGHIIINEPEAGVVALTSFLKNKKRLTGLTGGGLSPKFISYEYEGLSGKGGLDGGLKNLKKIAISSIAILLLVSVYLGVGYYYKLQEVKTIQSKIKTVLLKYYPGRKVFYEPRFEIKSYYDKLKSARYSSKEALNILNFLNYLSKFKYSGAAGVVINLKSISYSFGSINFSGRISGGNRGFNNLLGYLKNHYETLKVVKSGENGFEILIKLN